MIGAWLMALCAAAGGFLAWEGWQAYQWHHRGGGERAARQEYARLRSAGVDTAETRLSETAFIHYYMGTRPGAARYAIAALALLVIGLPLSLWTVLGGWP